MFRFDWSDLATDGFLEKLRADAGSDADNDLLRPLMADIFGHVGGLPIAKTQWSNKKRTSVALRLLNEAIGHTLAAGGRRSRLPGFDQTKVDGSSPITQQVVEVDRVDVNSADAATLAALPVLGQKLADRIVAVRRMSGPFRGLTDLAAGVHRLSMADAERLAGRLDFADLRQSRPAEVDVDLHALLADAAVDVLLTHVAPGASLEAALDCLAVATAAAPHPATVRGYHRTELEQDEVEVKTHRAAAVEIVEDAAYLGRIVELISAARTSVDVAMFYMAFSDNDHPNYNIVAALQTARKVGAVVRVVLDRDRADDPYGSEIINRTAIKKLAAAEIDVRVDQRDRLLHSKALAIDNRVVAIGSHNWTKNSYTTYHETTAIVHCESLATEWHKRFEAIWDAATAP